MSGKNTVSSGLLFSDSVKLRIAISNIFVLHFPVSHFPTLHFLSFIFQSRIFSRPGQRSRSRRRIALFAKNPHNFAACCPINLIFGRWRKDPLPRVPSLPWQRPFPPSVRTQLQGRPHSGRPLNGRTLLLLMCVVLAGDWQR